MSFTLCIVSIALYGLACPPDPVASMVSVALNGLVYPPSHCFHITPLYESRIRVQTLHACLCVSVHPPPPTSYVHPKVTINQFVLLESLSEEIS